MGPALLPSSTGSAPAFSSTPDRVGRDGALALAFERRGGGGAPPTPPSAPRVYRALAPPAVQETSIRLGAGATVEYVPDHVIPHPGSVFHQSLTAEMGPGSRGILSDALAIGRL